MDEQEVMQMMKKIRLLRYQTVMLFMEHLWSDGYVIAPMDEITHVHRIPSKAEIEEKITNWAYK